MFFSLLVIFYILLTGCVDLLDSGSNDEDSSTVNTPNTYMMYIKNDGSGTIYAINPSEASPDIHTVVTNTNTSASVIGGTKSGDSLTGIYSKWLLYLKANATNSSLVSFYKVKAVRTGDPTTDLKVFQLSNLAIPGNTLCALTQGKEGNISYLDINNETPLYLKLSGLDTACNTHDDEWMLIYFNADANTDPTLNSNIGYPLTDIIGGPKLVYKMNSENREDLRECDSTFTNCIDVTTDVTSTFGSTFKLLHIFQSTRIAFFRADKTLYAYDFNRRIDNRISTSLHTFTSASMQTAYSNGNYIYFSDNTKVHRVKKDGTEKVGPALVTSDSTIGKLFVYRDETIVYGTNGPSDYNLYLVKADGTSDGSSPIKLNEPDSTKMKIMGGLFGSYFYWYDEIKATAHYRNVSDFSNTKTITVPHKGIWGGYTWPNFTYDKILFWNQTIGKLQVYQGNTAKILISDIGDFALNPPGASYDSHIFPGCENALQDYALCSFSTKTGGITTSNRDIALVNFSKTSSYKTLTDDSIQDTKVTF